MSEMIWGGGGVRDVGLGRAFGVDVSEINRMVHGCLGI